MLLDVVVVRYMAGEPTTDRGGSSNGRVPTYNSIGNDDEAKEKSKQGQ